jgi:hypothetical protein
MTLFWSGFFTKTKYRKFLRLVKIGWTTSKMPFYGSSDLDSLKSFLGTLVNGHGKTFLPWGLPHFLATHPKGAIEFY